MDYFDILKGNTKMVRSDLSKGCIMSLPVGVASSMD
jgi:hypothetical protein